MRINILLSAFLTFFCLNSYSQKGEVGIFTGVSYYNGEVNQITPFKSVSPAIGIIYRYNFNPRFVLRIDGVYSRLTGDDANSNYLYQQQRNYSFSTPIIDIALQCEFNFLTYIKENDYLSFTPYVVSGAVLLIASGENTKTQIAIPFGIGVKYAITKRLSIGAEWSYRMTLSDDLDQLPDDNPDITRINQSKQFSNSKNNDWYSFAGLIFTYNINYGVGHCPAFKKDKHSK